MLPPSRTVKYKNLLGGITMSRENVIDPAFKVELVERYLVGEINITEATRLAGVRSRGSFHRWIHIYKNEGATGFLDQKPRKYYSVGLKRAAVKAYLNGEGSLREIAEKYNIRSEKTLQNWIKAYNVHGEIKSHASGGGYYMSNAKQTTLEERLEIVQDCLANNKNYGETASKYSCSYQQVRNWVQRYEKMGSAGLEDRRGKRVGTQPARTPEEELRDKIAELERKTRELQMENDLLKKVRELEMKDRYL